jgi:hypothetical protein
MLSKLGRCSQRTAEIHARTCKRHPPMEGAVRFSAVPWAISNTIHGIASHLFQRGQFSRGFVPTRGVPAFLNGTYDAGQAQKPPLVANIEGICFDAYRLQCRQRRRPRVRLQFPSDYAPKAGS